MHSASLQPAGGLTDDHDKIEPPCTLQHPHQVPDAVMQSRRHSRHAVTPVRPEALNA